MSINELTTIQGARRRFASDEAVLHGQDLFELKTALSERVSQN